MQSFLEWRETLAYRAMLAQEETRVKAADARYMLELGKIGVALSFQEQAAAWHKAAWVNLSELLGVATQEPA